MANDWLEVPLGKLLTRIKNEVLIQDFERYQRLTIHGNNKGISIRDEFEGHQIGTKNQFVVHKGQFLLSKIDAMNGAFGIVPENVEKGIITSNFWAYDVDEEKLLSKYFNYLTHTRTFQQFCIQSSSGTTHRKYLQEDLFLGKEIPLPPLSEQHRIVEHIETLAARIAQAQSLREKAINESSLLIFSKTNELFENLQHFPKVSLGELGVDKSNPIQTGPFGSQLLTNEFVDSGVPVLNVGNVQPEGLKLTRVDHVTPEKAETLARYSLQENDLLFARTGATLGKVCVLPKGCDGWLMTGHLFRVRFDTTRCNPRYAFVALRGADSVRSQIFGQVRGATRPGFNTTLLSHVEIPLPPLDEQRRIVAYLDSVQARLASLRELQSATGEELSALLPSILDKAFKGKL